LRKKNIIFKGRIVGSELGYKAINFVSKKTSNVMDKYGDGSED
jgi:hypothetical protein